MRTELTALVGKVLLDIEVTDAIEQIRKITTATT
jgi:hypothetical protein